MESIIELNFRDILDLILHMNPSSLDLSSFKSETRSAFATKPDIPPQFQPKTVEDFILLQSKMDSALVNYVTEQLEAGKQKKAKASSKKEKAPRSETTPVKKQSKKAAAKVPESNGHDAVVESKRKNTKAKANGVAAPLAATGSSSSKQRIAGLTKGDYAKIFAAHQAMTTAAQNFKVNEHRNKGNDMVDRLDKEISAKTTNSSAQAQEFDPAKHSDYDYSSMMDPNRPVTVYYSSNSKDPKYNAHLPPEFVTMMQELDGRFTQGFASLSEQIDGLRGGVASSIPQYSTDADADMTLPSSP